MCKGKILLGLTYRVGGANGTGVGGANGTGVGGANGTGVGGANGTGWEGLMVQGKRIKYEEMEGERVCQQKAAITKAPSRKSFKTC